MAPITAVAATYTLHAVTFHQGSSSRCGHYTSRVRLSSGRWCNLDDETVQAPARGKNHHSAGGGGVRAPHA
eukprot:SAG25_NODE_360_length_9166_cov_35.113488_6_plen_71_part_00